MAIMLGLGGRVLANTVNNHERIMHLVWERESLKTYVAEELKNMKIDIKEIERTVIAIELDQECITYP